jgi:hypothetical protein
MTRAELTEEIIKEILAIPEGEYTRDWRQTRIRQDLDNLVDERFEKLGKIEGNGQG